jgi:hypothetical protein
VGIARSGPLALDHLRRARGVTGTVLTRGRAQYCQDGALCAPPGASAASQPGPGQTSRRWRARRGQYRPAAGVAPGAVKSKKTAARSVTQGRTNLHDHHTPHCCSCVSCSRRGCLSQRRQLAPGACGHVEAVHICRGAGESNTRGGSAAGGVLKCGRPAKQDQPLGGVAHARGEGVAATRKWRIRRVERGQPADAGVDAGVCHVHGVRSSSLRSWMHPTFVAPGTKVGRIGSDGFGTPESDGRTATALWIGIRTSQSSDSDLMRRLGDDRCVVNI